MQQYQIEYRLNGVSNIFELYLFVNPLGQACYISERELLKLPDYIAANIDIHILPIHNQKLVKAYMIRHGINHADLKARNAIFHAIYQASLAYKAACIQGKKNGRLYLMRMQEEFQGDISHFSNEFALQLAKEIGLDIETFISDFQSDFVRQLFLKDQNIAVELKVDTSPSLTIFEYMTDSVKLISERPITIEKILAIIDEIVIDGIKNADFKKKKAKLKLL